MKKVLVVDDSAFVRLSIKTMLEQNECIIAFLIKPFQEDLVLKAL